MKLLFIPALLLLVSFTHLTGAAQPKNTIVIIGKVISFEESFPLEGVSIQVKGAKSNTGTQADGTFSLELKEGDKVLVFSQEGYETLEIKIEPAKKEYNVILKRTGN